MLHYHPPKSRIWGQQVGRLAASQVVERGLRFLNERCVNVTMDSSDIRVSELDSPVPGAVQAITALWGGEPQVDEGRDADGSVIRSFKWPLAAAQLPAVARWFDSVRQQLTRGATPFTSTYWSFDWPGPPPPSKGSKPAFRFGGTLGIHLGCPHRVTTMFSFRDVEHYAEIKAYLSGIGLVDLSDKHVRPKLGT